MSSKEGRGREYRLGVYFVDMAQGLCPGWEVQILPATVSFKSRSCICASSLSKSHTGRSR